VGRLETLLLHYLTSFYLVESHLLLPQQPQRLPGGKVVSFLLHNLASFYLVAYSPPPATPEVAWWKGWKLIPLISDNFTPSEII